MAPTDDLKSHATSTTDFYALLSLAPTFTQSELDRAWRKTALKYHPDKVGPHDTVAKEKFHLAQIGYDVLSDPAVRALYDAGRQARERKERERELMGAKRREDREKLEKRERMSGVGVRAKRAWGEMEGDDMGDEERLEREVRRLAEDGRRRREERERELRAEALREKQEAEQHNNIFEAESFRHTPAASAATPTVPETDRTVTIRWTLDDPTATTPPAPKIDHSRLISLFSTFGEIEHATAPKERLPKNKNKKPNSTKKKSPLASAAVVYKSIVGAHAAVADWSHKSGDEWEAIKYVFWTVGKEPDLLKQVGASTTTTKNAVPPSSSSPSPSTPARNGVPHPPFASASGNKTKPDIYAFLRDGGGGGKSTTTTPAGTPPPSFASFSSATPTKAAPLYAAGLAAGGGRGGLSLEELTMIRLKNAERRRAGERDREK